MTSMLCIQEPGGFVEQNHREFSDVVLKDSSNYAVFAKYFPDDKVRPRFHSKRPFSTPNPHISSDNIDRQGLMGHSMKLQTWLNNKSVRLVQEKSDMEARPVKQMYSAVLDREDTFVKDLQEYVDNHEYLGERKKEILHKNWSDRVYEPIRKAVTSQMDSENYSSYKRRKDQLYREYIEHVNKKGHVFRDDYCPSEYYAMGLHGTRPMVVAGLQAKTEKPLRDPTLLQENMRDDEDETIIRCTSGSKYRGKSLDKIRLPTLPLVPLGRHGTENETWTAMPLTDIESPIRQASSSRSKDLTTKPILRCARSNPLTMNIDTNRMRRMVGTNLKSEINFGHWSMQKYGQDMTETELGIQKRRQCPQPPFTAPRAVGHARRTLPAARESYKSRTLPLSNANHSLEATCPFGIDVSDTTSPPQQQQTLNFQNNTANFSDCEPIRPDNTAMKGIFI